MKEILPATIIILLLACSFMRARAYSPWETVENKLEYIERHLEANGYEIVAMETSSISTMVTFAYTLEPGEYRAIGEADGDIYDLGIFIYGEDGSEIASSPVSRDSVLGELIYGEDGYEVPQHAWTYERPEVEFSLDEIQAVQVDVEVFVFTDDYDYGYVGLIIGREAGAEEAEQIASTGSFSADARLRYTRWRYLDFDPAYWQTWFESRQDYIDAWEEFWEDWDPSRNDFDGWMEEIGPVYASPGRIIYDTGEEQEDESEWYLLRSSRDRWDTVVDTLDDLYAEAYDLRMIPIVDHVARIVYIDSIMITLPAGEFLIRVEGGSNIETIDCTVYELGRFEIDGAQVYPAARYLTIDNQWQTQYELEFEAAYVDEFNEAAFYCVLISMEPQQNSM